MVPGKGGAGCSPADGRTEAGMVIGTTCDAGTGGGALWGARDGAGACDFGAAGDAALPSVFDFFAAGPVSDIALARLRLRWRD